MLIQIPIFFGLFTMLRQAVELRNATSSGFSDLSQPDTVAHLPVARLADQHSSAHHGGDQFLDDAHDAEDAATPRSSA